MEKPFNLNNHQEKFQQNDKNKNNKKRYSKKKIVLIILLFSFCILLILYFNQDKIIGSLINKVEYCSLENKCPDDKCVVKTSCGRGNDLNGLGCEYFVTGCEYKHPKLKNKYNPITREKALKCAKKYMKKNKDKYEIYKILSESNEPLIVFESICDSWIDEDENDLEDIWCYMLDLQINYDELKKHGSLSGGEFYSKVGDAPDLYIGTETCNIYY